MGRPNGSRFVGRRVAALALLGAVAALTVIGFAPGNAVRESRSTGLAAQPALLANAAPVAASLQLGISASPHAICAFESTNCPAGTGLSRVTLTASAGSVGALAWKDVQVAFVLETTSYDGVYDPTVHDPGRDACANSAIGATVCEESNGVPFFIANAQGIANAISAANPHSKVSFALVDYFATKDDWDDGDGAEYHVDTPTFVDSNGFGEAVQSSFHDGVLQGGWTYSDSDLSDNQLHSSSITALYGTIIGSGLGWTNDTHHVIVWIGSTAPRDPTYTQDPCVGPQGGLSPNCQTSGCEPSYLFPLGASPNCEGWVRSSDGNATHSIAALAHTAAACTGSVGGVCTIDTIDLYTTPTDPESQGWPVLGTPGSGPGGSLVVKNVERVLSAGCDLAQATGGSWNGPNWASCSDGRAGTLSYIPHGAYNSPQTSNPTLFNALRGISFGPVLESQVATGTDRPLFTFVPIGNIAPAAGSALQATAACLRNGVPITTCQATPTFLSAGGVRYLGWNWSTNASRNALFFGDVWTASFNVVATGPPYATVPVDACVDTGCAAGGSGAVNGVYTAASYVPDTNGSVVTQSFPLAQVQVEIAATSVPPELPPAAPVPPPGIPILAPSPLPVLQPSLLANTALTANVALQATAAGFLGAGFTAVGLRNRPIANKIAARSGAPTAGSKFDTGPDGAPPVGRFE